MMIAKINCVEILKDHFSTLKNNDTGRVSVGDIALFYLFPIGIAVLLVAFFKPTEALSNILVTALSIFAALLFNLLLLVLDAIRKANTSSAVNADRLQVLLRETYANIAYSVFISLVAIVILAATYIFEIKVSPWPQRIVWTIIYALLGNFVFTLLMILKRMHVSISYGLVSEPLPGGAKHVT